MDLERELKFIHARIGINSKANHIALLMAQQTLEILESDSANKEHLFKFVLGKSSEAIDIQNKEIELVNAEFKDIIDAAELRDPTNTRDDGKFDA